MAKRKQHEPRRMSGWEHFDYWSTALIHSAGLWGILVMCWFDSLISGWIVFSAPIAYFLLHVIAFIRNPYSDRED